MPELTQSRVKELFDYNPETGDLVRIKYVAPKAKIGDIAGCKVHGSYTVLKVDKRQYGIHRIIWLWLYGAFPQGEIDHINQNKAYNTKKNLRDVSRRINSRNEKLRSLNTSGTMGVHWDKRRSKWMAQIRDNDGRRFMIGRFNSLADAISARKEAEKLYGYHQNHGSSINQQWEDR